MKKTAALMLGLLLVLGACSNNSTTESTAATGDTGSTVAVTGGVGSGVTPGLFASSLQSFDSCEAFLAHVKAEAVERVTAYGLPGFGYYGFGGPVFAEFEEVAADDAGRSAATTVAAAEQAAPVAGQDYSTTNVQEVGVDEPDIVKTDGTRILAINGNRLHYIDVAGEAPELVGSLTLPWGWNQELLMSGDTAIVAATASRYDIDPRVATGVFAPDYGYSEISLFAEIDLSDPENLRIVQTLYVDGRYLSARMVGDTARFVFTSAPVGLDFVIPAGGGLRGEQRAAEVNREVIEESTIDNWLPYYILEDGDGEVLAEGTLLECESALYPPEFSGFGMTSIMTIDLSEGIDPAASIGVLTNGETIYASADNLYVATQRWVEWETLDDVRARQEVESMTTYVHRFDISDPASAVYEASGSVEGFLLNQFAMSEHEGLLRVASTSRPTWWWWGDTGGTPESKVSVFESRDGELVEIGSVGGLGRGEQIYSVRFVGDVGYVVTFRQTDPLYTIDLSDPANPVTAGELKILGYSAYLHPIGDGLLLGVGQDATETGRVTGSQVSVFDVSDIANPQRLDTLTLDQGFSEVEYDHRAFLHWAQTGLTVMPVQWWAYDDDYELEDVFLGAVTFEVDAGGIERRADITHTEPKDGEDPWSYDWRGQIRRSLVVGDSLYTLSELGLKVSDLTTLADEGFLPLASGYDEPVFEEGDLDSGTTDGTIVEEG